jgi:hypothetical protein
MRMSSWLRLLALLMLGRSDSVASPAQTSRAPNHLSTRRARSHSGEYAAHDPTSPDLSDAEHMCYRKLEANPLTELLRCPPFPLGAASTNRTSAYAVATSASRCASRCASRDGFKVASIQMPSSSLFPRY